jgi:hypothetical protein
LSAAAPYGLTRWPALTPVNKGIYPGNCRVLTQVNATSAD